MPIVAPFLLFIASIAAAQQPQHCTSRLLSDIQPGLFSEGQRPASSAFVHDTSGGSRISFGGTYFDIVSDRTSDSAGTISSVNSDAVSAYASAVVLRTPWTLSAWWNWSRMDLAWSDRANNLAADASAALHEGGVGIGFAQGRVTTDAALWVAPGASGLYTRPSVSQTLGGSWSLLWNVKAFSVGFFAERSPVLASLARIETLSSGAGRAFPLSLIRTQFLCPVSFAFPSVTLGITPGFSRLASDTTPNPAEKLNSVVSAHDASVFLWAKTTQSPLPVSFECSVRKWRLGIAGYDGTTMYATIDNGKILDGWAEAAVELPHLIRAGIFGELTDGNVPQGYFEAFPFTSWTIFDPVHYKISRLWAVFHEAGLFADARCRFLRFSEIEGGADCSFDYAQFVLGTRERKIEILIPYYTGESVVSSEVKMIVLKLRLGYAFSCEKYSLRIQVRQLIPWRIPEHQNPQAISPPSRAQSAVSRATFGGLRLDASGTIDF
jgi:hypothetical protein